MNIADDLFTANKNRVRIFCEELKRRGVKIAWTAFSRVNTVDEQVLAVMREAGCDSVNFGIESGNIEMLKRVKKGITLEQARKAVKSCKDTGVLAHASFMIGLPGESPQTTEDSYTFAQSLGIAYGFHLLAPFPGTTVREEQEKYDIEFLTDDWDLYDANVPIVRTSTLSEQYTARFMEDFEARHRELWNDILKKFNEGTCSDDEYLRVAGHNRMHLVFKILSTDLIERHGVFLNGDSGIRALAERITEATGADPELVRQTLDQFDTAGYIRQAREDETTRWYWTQNNRSDARY